jgi:hypothetical protein
MLAPAPRESDREKKKKTQKGARLGARVQQLALIYTPSVSKYKMF